MPNLCDSYSETNQNDESGLLWAIHPSGSTRSAGGQSFTGNDESLNSCKVHLKRTGSPGLMIARLYAHSGTFGTSSVPTGAALDSSSSINASTIGTSLGLVEFTGFSGYTLVNGTKYCIVVEALSGTWNGTTDYVSFGIDTSSPTHGGNAFYYNAGAWNAISGYDVCFYVYTVPAVLTITTQAASSIEDTTATGNGNITDLSGGGDADHRGVVWDVSTKSAPGDVTPALSGYANNTDEPGTFGTGAFTASITGLPTGTTIYYRAWAHNSLGYAYGDEVTFLTKPAAPTNVAATDGTHTTKVVATWTKPTGASGYKFFRDDVLVDTLGDVATYDDTGADAPVITPGTADASDGTSTAHVVLTLSGESVANGTTHTYKVVAFNATGDSADSATDTGYRGTTTLTKQWQRSAGDSDASYSAISGGTTDPYNDTGAPNPTITAGTTSATDGDHADKVVLSLSGESLSDGEGRYYKCVVSMSGAVSQTSTADRGYKSNSGSISRQAQVSSGDSDADYSNISGATTDPYDYMDAPDWGEGRYYKYVLSSTGASNATSAADRGSTTPPGNFPTPGSTRIRLALDSYWDDEDPVWTEINSGIRECSVVGGRNLPLNRMESFTMDIVLNNESGDFWPTNRNSPYVVSSDLTGTATLDTKIIPVTDGSLFTVGETYELIDDTPQCENCIIASIDGDNITVVNDLTHTYTTANNAVLWKTKLEPMIKINIQSYHDSVQDVFTGYIKSFEPGFLDGKLYGSTMTFHCVGIIGSVVALQVLNNAGYAEEAAGLRMNHILNDCGIPAAWLSGDGGAIDVQATGALKNVNALSESDKVQETDLGLLYEMPNGNIVYEDRGHRALYPHTESQATFGEGEGEIGYDSYKAISNEILLFNDVRITCAGGTEQVTSNSFSQGKYCTHSYVRSNTPHVSDADALLQSQYIDARRSHPFLYVTELTIIPSTPDQYTQMFTRYLSDRITFKNSAARINKDLFIESKQYYFNFVTGMYKVIFATSDATQYLNPLPLKTETLRPTAAGNVTGLTPSAGSNWDCVNDTTPDGDSTYVYSNTVKYDLYNIQDLPWDYGVIDSVTVTAHCRADSASCNAYMRIYTHSTLYEGAMKVLTGVYGNYSHVWAVNPYTGLAWTIDEINSLQIGIQVEPAPTMSGRCTQIYADVVITPTWG